MNTQAHTLIETHKCAFSHTYSQKQNFGRQGQVGFVFGSQWMEGIILASTLTLSGVQQTSVVPVVPSTFPSLN